MIRNLKAVGLLAFAALAMSAMFASAASAQELGTLTAGLTPETHEGASLVGTQYPDPADPEATQEEIEEWEDWNFFESGGDKVQCDTAELFGSTGNGTATEVKVEAEYTHCIARGQPATVSMNGCEYSLEQPETLEENVYIGGAALTCPHETAVEVDVYGFGNATNTSHFFKACTIEITPSADSHDEGSHTLDTLDGHIVYENNFSGPDDITATVTVDGVTSDATDCPEGVHDEDALYTSTVTIEAENENGQRDLWISD